MRESYLKRRYGIEFRQLQRLLASQDSKCAICRLPWPQCKPAKAKRDGETIFLHHLRVDHDHRSGVVRGLLCDACNTALGLLEERPARFRDAAKYIEDRNDAAADS
jgi:hypothetical protein